MGRNEASVEAAVKALPTGGMMHSGVTADLSDPEACARAVASTVEASGRLDVLVNAAGGPHTTAIPSKKQKKTLHRLIGICQDALLARVSLPQVMLARQRRQFKSMDTQRECVCV